MYVERIFSLAAVLVVCAAMLQGQEWKDDAERANKYAEAGDYNAAWVFYKRALARGCDDGLTIYSAAEALRRQTLGENADFAKELYAVASYYLAEQNLESPALDDADSYIERDIKRREIARAYARLGIRLPKTYKMISTRFDAVQIFIVSSFEETMQLFATLISEGPRVTLNWARSRMPELLLSILVASLLTGIILPTLMAIMVAREGRKSYVSAYAFLIHWGFLGIHRFYLGRYASGLLWLFTGGLLGIGVFFDLFLTGALVRFWNEDHRTERLMRRKGANVASGRQGPRMRTRFSKTRTSPNVAKSAPNALRRDDRTPANKDSARDDFPDMSEDLDF